jgi:hypothetical protein
VTDRDPISSRELRSKAAMARCLLGGWPGRALVLAIVVALAGRTLLAGTGVGAPDEIGLGVGAADAIVVAVGLILIGPVEWVVHQHLFHAPTTSWRWRRLGTGRRHHLHHDEPDRIEWLLLDARGVTLLLGASALLVAGWAIPVGLAIGLVEGDAAVGRVVAVWLSGVVVAWAALVHYEWTHLLDHAGYRPSTRRYRRLARRHLYHHHRDDGRWLGVTSNLGDHLFGTGTMALPNRRSQR